MNLHRARLGLLSAATLVLSACSGPMLTGPLADVVFPVPIVFVHGNGDSANLWQTTLWRFESN
ncbi:MAG: twin-arginine translocation pathway signal, partial [Limnohabitans sp.]|nr:twin-arginine translocation pathway signal [Limnohabitans sp.]